MFPRPVTPADSRAGLTRQLGQAHHAGHAQHPYADVGLYAGPETGQPFHPEQPYQQLPGPFLGRDLPPHLFPPRNWENIDQQVSVPFGPIGTTVTIIDYRVPIGRNGIINQVANSFVGGGWTAGTGDVVWRILINGASPPGATTYHRITDSLGSPALPVGIAGFRIFENQRVTVTATNDPTGANGGIIFAGQRVGARLLGWLFPRDMEYHDLFV